MILKPCPFCQKDIPRSIQVCPYCHRDEQGKSVQIDSREDVQMRDKEIVQDLQHLLADDALQRQGACERLVRRGASVVPMLIPIMEDLKKPHLEQVATALGRLKDKRAIASLTQAARLGSEELRLSAIWALTQFQEPEALAPLLREAETAHPVIQPYLAFKLGEFRDPQATATLARLASSKHRETAFQSTWALGDTADKRAGSALRKAFHSKDPLIKAAAKASLQKLGISAVVGGVPGWVIGVAVAAIGVVVFLVYR